VGLIFFEETVDGNAGLHRDIIITQFISRLHVDEQDCWLQQDGATFHMSD
jgi:hypothetical protein